MSVLRRLHGWLFAPMPVARVAVLRWLVFAFVVIDVLFLHTSGWYHGHADPVWYEPLVMGEVLHLPPATVVLVNVLKWGCVIAALLAMTGRAPRLLGWAVAICWIWYQYVAFSYGKVDHDRADFVVALALLPTVGLAHLSDRRKSEAAGFALRAVQMAAIATYFLSAFAKLRFGGPEWVNSATMVRAVVRRGTPWAQWLLEIPWTLHWFQWVLMIAELSAPVIFLVSEKWRRRLVGAWFVFHAMTYAAITIAFWPHLVMMLAFLPLEEYARRLRAWWMRTRLGRWVEQRWRSTSSARSGLPSALGASVGSGGSGGSGVSSGGSGVSSGAGRPAASTPESRPGGGAGSPPPSGRPAQRGR